MDRVVNGMKVGIITFHNVPNYGAVLQAYSLYKLVEQVTGDVEVLDYSNLSVDNYYKPRVSVRIMGYIRSLLKQWKIAKFVKSYIRLSHNDFRKNNYDAIVCGSDQIWSINSTQGFDTTYFIGFADDGARKISYAPSANQTDSFGENKESISKLLDSFHSISVRDLHTQDLLSRECNKQAVKVLDPTFLVDFSNLEKNPHLNYPYLLVYFDGGLNKEVVKEINRIAKTRSLQIVSIGYFPESISKCFLTASPEEWLGLFKKADYIVTNSFHGTVFSIKYKKPFKVILSSHKITKVYDLLNSLDLTSAIHNPDSSDVHISYDKVENILNEKIRASKQYLIDSLS